MDVGDKLKRLRKRRKFTQKQIAEGTNLSMSFLSQVELGRSSLTLESLKKISEFMNVNPSYFFAQGDEDNTNQKIAINKHNVGNKQDEEYNFTYKDLSGNFSNQLFMPTLVTLQPRNNNARPLPHRGQEFIFVLSGKLSILFDNEVIDIDAGESIHMESTVPHNWLNRTHETIQFLYISST